MIQELQTERLDINNKYDIDFSCKQLDDIILKIIVYDKSLPADLSDYTCRLKAFKADQVPLIQNTNITIKENIIEIKASKQLTTTAGVVKAELQFINKTTLEKKSTFYINIEVVASVLDVDGVVSTPTCTILEEIDHKLDQIENIGQVLDEAKDVRDTLTNTTIPTATNINSKLESNINSANTKITEVENIISSATSKIEEVETSINNADSSKKELDLSKTNADISKENLDAANTLGEKNIEELNSLGNVTDLAKNVQTNTTDITKLKTDVENNTSQLKDNTQHVSQLSNPNLLINGDFRIHQRDDSFILDNTSKYTFDRWKAGGLQKLGYSESSLFIKTFSDERYCAISQPILVSELGYRIKDKLTLSVCLNSPQANIKSKIAIILYDDDLKMIRREDKPFITGKEWEPSLISLTIDTNGLTKNGRIDVYIMESKPTIEQSIYYLWAKLELGSVATPFVPRSYGEELALCQRYYLSNKGYGNNWRYGCYPQGGGFRILMPTQSGLRTRPTLIENSLGSIEFYGDDSNWHKLKFTQSYVLDGGGVEIAYAVENPNGVITTGKSYIVKYLPSLDAEIY